MNKEDKLLTIKSILDHCDDISHLLSDLQKDYKESGVLISMREHNYDVESGIKFFKNKIEDEEYSQKNLKSILIHYKDITDDLNNLILKSNSTELLDVGNIICKGLEKLCEIVEKDNQKV